MSRIADRLLARITGNATADAGCTTYRYCRGGQPYYRTCCLNEGCQDAPASGKC
ncbi:hypothetical protein ACFOY4_07540 [Actinomadura syzygii]|uniref:hypothetical protein n=1 Tax=Actinomadura syzygii TaxID=1427538 RepID=UPI0016526680|nr:hypothetical protein [Actinomadura syzygii]